MGHRSFTLECTPDRFRARASAGGGLTTIQAQPDDAARCRDLWREVGAGFWTERCRWGLARWRERLCQSNVTFWIAVLAQHDAGCFELSTLARGVKIEGFGLLAPDRGRGLGRDLLTAATQLAFATGAPESGCRVWLHTATDDHPHALPNYLAGGYRIIRERELANPMPTRQGESR